MYDKIQTPVIRGVVTSEEFGVLRLIYIDNEVLFCGRDVTMKMGFADPRKTISTYCMNIRRLLHDTCSGKQYLNFIDFKDVLRLFRHSKSEYACDYIIYLKDIMKSFLDKIDEVMEQEPVPENMTYDIVDGDAETEKALEDFAETINELHDKYGISVAIEGVYLDEGDERYRLI